MTVKQDFQVSICKLQFRLTMLRLIYMIRKIFSLACFGIGVFMYSGANAIEYTAIDNAPIEKLIKACEAGDGDICRRVARAYFYGNNVKIDFKNAVLYHQKAWMWAAAAITSATAIRKVWAWTLIWKSPAMPT